MAYLYQRLKHQYSYDGGITWFDYDPIEYRVGQLIQENANCANQVITDWEDIPFDSSTTEGYLCEGTDLYTKQKQLISYDNGVNWQDVEPSSFKKGTLVEKDWYLCGGSQYPPIYQWVEIPFDSADSNSYICDLNNGNLYKKEKKQYSTDNGKTWVDTDPLEVAQGDLIAEESEVCAIYKWELVEYNPDDPRTYICDDFMTYEKYIRMMSTDGGLNWVEVSPTESQRGALISTFGGACDKISGNYSLIVSRIDNKGILIPNSEYKETFYEGEFGHTELDMEKIDGYYYGIPIESGSFYYVDSADESGSLPNDEYQLQLHLLDFTKNKCNYQGSNKLFMFFNFNILDEALESINNSIRNYNGEDKLRLRLNGLIESSNDIININKIDVCNISYFDNCFGNISTEWRFNAKSFDLSNWNTSKAVSMISMFEELYYLTELNGLNNWDVSNVTDMNTMFKNCKLLTSLDISDWNTSNVTNMSYMFAECSSLTSLDISDWNTSNVTNMNNMFGGCSALTSLDVTDWNVSNVTDMGYMFSYCTALTPLNVSTWNVANVKDMTLMFNRCKSLTSLDVTDWNVANVEDMYGMFSNCTSLESLDLSKWDVSNVTDMRFMFSNCSGLTSLNLNNWTIDLDKKNPDNYSFESIVDGCYNLNELKIDNWKILSTDNSTSFTDLINSICSINKTSIDLSTWDVSNVDYSMRGMFSNCTSLKSLDLSTWDVSSISYMNSMFSGCTSLESLDLSDWNVGCIDFTDFAYNCPNLKSVNVDNWKINCNTRKIGQLIGSISENGVTSLDLSTWDISSISDMRGMFSGSTSSESFELNISNWDASHVNNMDDMFYYITIGTLDLSNWTIGDSCSMNRMFGNINTLILDGWKFPENFDFSEFSNAELYPENISINNWKLSGAVKNLNGFINLLRNNIKFDSFDSLSTWDVSNVTSMYEMFRDLTALTSLDLSKWDVSNVTTMNSMFYMCNSLTSVGDISNWNTSNVTNMFCMFRSCTSLTSLDLSGWDVSNVTGSVYEMFYYCKSLTSLELSNWNTSNINDMSEMFYNCSSLTSLDLSGWNTSNVTNMSSMFRSCTSLKSLDLSNWDMSNIINDILNYMSNMFNGCRNLSSITCTQATKDKLMTLDTNAFPTRDTVQWTIVG